MLPLPPKFMVFGKKRGNVTYMLKMAISAASYLKIGQINVRNETFRYYLGQKVNPI